MKEKKIKTKSLKEIIYLCESRLTWNTLNTLTEAEINANKTLYLCIELMKDFYEHPNN